MLALAVLLATLNTAPPPGGVAAVRLTAPLTFSMVAPSSPGVPTGAAAGTASGANPVCVDDVCQPRVSVPGYEPKLDWKTKQALLFLSVVERLRIGPITKVAWAIASSGIGVDYRPPAFAGADAVAHSGWGSVRVDLRFRLDATNSPVFLSRPGSP